MMAAGGAALGAASLTPASLSYGSEKESGEAQETEAAATPFVYVVDRITAKPGDGEALMEEYLSFYAPLAEQCGAELVSKRVAPPFWLPMDSNTLEFTWRVSGIGGCWGIASPQRANPDVVAWWAGLRDRVVDQDRSYFADPSDMEGLNYV